MSNVPNPDRRRFLGSALKMAATLPLVMQGGIPSSSKEQLLKREGSFLGQLYENYFRDLMHRMLPELNLRTLPRERVLSITVGEFFAMMNFFYREGSRDYINIKADFGLATQRPGLRFVVTDQAFPHSSVWNFRAESSAPVGDNPELTHRLASLYSDPEDKSNFLKLVEHDGLYYPDLSKWRFDFKESGLSQNFRLLFLRNEIGHISPTGPGNPDEEIFVFNQPTIPIISKEDDRVSLVLLDPNNLTKPRQVFTF